ncbi:MAG TPA: DUF3806 domain-containing protein [Pirellulales bacterium]|nr:DUF3806 domain-containing protein [Pirellulales bacterium]
MGKTRYSDLAEKEWTWVRSQLDAVPVFIEAYSPDDAGRPITLQMLDRIFASWLTQDIRDNAQVNAAINIVGVQFGQLLVEAAGFQWVIATANGHSDLAILALPRRGDVLVYPANFVAKRWEKRESNFIAEAFEAIRQQVEQIKAAGTTDTHRPWWRFW